MDADDLKQLAARVVDHRLQAGRGDEFSAGAIRQAAKRRHDELLDQGAEFVLPRNARVEDGLDQASLLAGPIPESNRGYALLQRMGWQQGQGLGREEQGITEPVTTGVEPGARLGLGKQEQESFFMDAENVQRRQMEAEVQAAEDETRTRQRQADAERSAAIQNDLLSVKQNLYCQTCAKQYKTASELEVHLSSYDHHHRKRLLEMRAEEAQRTKVQRERKERKRLEKDATRLSAQIAAASYGAALPPPPSVETAAVPGPEAPPPPPPLPPADEAAEPLAPPAPASVQIKLAPFSASQGKLGAQAGRKATFGGRAGPHAAERLKPAAAAFAAGSDDD